MNVTPDQIIVSVCKVLELDRDKLFQIKRKRTEKGRLAGSAKEEKYYYGECLIAYLIRQKVKSPKETKRFGKEMNQPTYKEIATTLNRKSHEAIIRYELDCRIKLRDKNSEFKAKYDMVVNLLDNNVNIA